MKNFLLLLLSFTASISFTQKENNLIETNWTKKHKMYIAWGYNRSTYGKSDINFVGSGMD